jgi:choline-glycine betaine transporter
MPHRYDTDYEIGQDNIRTWGMDFHNPVFVISALLVLVFVIGTIMFPGPAKEAFDGSKGWSIDNFDWLFLVAGNLFVLFCIALIFLPVGPIRLGGVDARAAAIAVGLPFTLALLAMCIALYMGLRHEQGFVLGDEGTRVEKTREA